MAAALPSRARSNIRSRVLLYMKACMPSSILHYQPNLFIKMSCLAIFKTGNHVENLKEEENILQNYAILYRRHQCIPFRKQASINVKLKLSKSAPSNRIQGARELCLV